MEVACKKKYWNEVKQINFEFFQIVEDINPGDDCALYGVDIPYGELVGDHISQFLPLKSGGFTRLTDPNLPCSIINDLGYGKDNSPIGFVSFQMHQLHSLSSHQSHRVNHF